MSDAKAARFVGTAPATARGVKAPAPSTDSLDLVDAIASSPAEVARAALAATPCRVDVVRQLSGRVGEVFTALVDLNLVSHDPNAPLTIHALKAGQLVRQLFSELAFIEERLMDDLNEPQWPPFPKRPAE